MTALDQVFLKAYGKTTQTKRLEEASASVVQGRRIDPAHSSPVPPVVEPLPVPAAEPTVASVTSPLFQPPDQGRLDARHDTPRPHWALGSPVPAAAAEAPAPSTTIDTARRGSPDPADRLTEGLLAGSQLVNLAEGVGRPAPSETVEPEQHEEAAPQSTAPLRAAFEVDRFLWPETCQKLLTTGSWSEASRELAAAAREGQQVFVIASQHRGEGRTTLALCLAQRLSEKNLRVTLVDADFHRPQLARQLKLLPAATWDDVLRGTLPLTESWIESVEDGVTLLPLKERADTTGLIGNPRLKEQFSLLRRMNDIVLIDAGSLEDFTDREVLALLGGTAQIDGALIVRDVRKTAAGELEQAPRCLDALGISRVDVVENFVRN